MHRIRIIPVLLLQKAGLYKTIRFKDPTYIGDPVNIVKIFNEKEADEIVLLDFTASRDERNIDFKKIAEIAGEAFMPMAYGGAIASLQDARNVFDAGFEKVVLNSILFKSPGLVKEIAEIFGGQSVVGSIDFKKNILGKRRVYSHSGSVNTGFDPIDWAKQLEKLGVGEIILNSIDKDGTWGGYDNEVVKMVSESVSIPVIACGGAADLKDFEQAVDHGASAVAAGSMFVYQRKGKGILVNMPVTYIMK